MRVEEQSEQQKALDQILRMPSYKGSDSLDRQIKLRVPQRIAETGSGITKKLRLRNKLLLDSMEVKNSQQFKTTP